ncbi:MAG TPA: redoxin domain-containing protein [Gemmataceae bacterium]|nr:redoxin domain-containing protein [Gemmataceae bacterium]
MKCQGMGSFLALIFGSCLIFDFPARSAETEVKIGDKIGNLTFKDIRYLPRSLNDFPKQKAIVLVFTNTTCPLAQRYLPTLQELDKEYRKKGVQFLAVNVGAEDSILMMAAQAVKHEMEIPFVKDFDAKCAQALGVKRTPEAVVLDECRVLRYRGRINDQYRLGGVKAEPSRQDLKEAIESVLAGREVEVKETPVDGCLITRAELPLLKTPVTFAEHIAPIVQNHCQVCHRPGTTAPFSLITYKQVASKADTIAEVVAEQRMPPWYASPEHGQFVNRRVLTAEERELVGQWVRSGKPLGDEAKLPITAPEWKDDGTWLIGKPDKIISAILADTLPASGAIPYKYVVLPYVFPEDTWVQGVQILPDNPRVVHHSNMAFGSLKEGFKQANFITGFVPGGAPMVLEDGIAFKIPKGSALALQIHYVTTGKEEKCRISVGLKYAQGIVQKQLRFTLFVDTKFAIPPEAPAHPVKVTKVLDHDILGLGLFAHMHLRGKDMTFNAHYPDGKSETLLVIPNYSFNWQIPYVWEAGKMRLPKGTRVECIAHYDNSPFNPYNPNPQSTVKDGPQTYHEMMNGFMFYTHADEKLNLEIDPKSGKVATRELKEKKGSH